MYTYNYGRFEISYLSRGFSQETGDNKILTEIEGCRLNWIRLDVVSVCRDMTRTPLSPAFGCLLMADRQHRMTTADANQNRP